MVSLSEPALTDLVAFYIRIPIGRALEELLLPDAAACVRANGPVTHLMIFLFAYDDPNLQGCFDSTYNALHQWSAMRLAAQNSVTLKVVVNAYNACL